MYEIIAAVTILAGIVLYIRILASSRKRRREQTNDEVDFDDWEKGSPDDDIPPTSKKIEFDPWK